MSAYNLSGFCIDMDHFFKFDFVHLRILSELVGIGNADQAIPLSLHLYIVMKEQFGFKINKNKPNRLDKLNQFTYNSVK